MIIGRIWGLCRRFSSVYTLSRIDGCFRRLSAEKMLSGSPYA